jgi:type IV pilus assembly protein PilY1
VTQRSSTAKFRARVIYGALLSFSFQLQAHAADISNIPLATQASATVRANLMFIMDDSLSMDSEYVPDNADYSNLCFGSSQTNAIFYNPNVVYTPPLKADGTSFADASFTAAKEDGYASSSSLRDLSSISNLTTPSTRVGTNSSGYAITSKFYYATYKTSVTPTTPACGTGYDWTKWNIVTSSSSWTAAQKTNYANWYSYYRSRMLSMRAAVGRAMGAIDASRFRVGYSAISSNSYVASTGFLPVADFDQGTQKADFYSKVYAAPTTGYTPLRPALEKIGKYYAGRQRNGSALPSGAVDPLQYSCQRNYSILTTDGYWNREDEPSDNYTPTRLNGSTAIGNPDSGTSIPRPRRDDGRLSGTNWVTGGSGVSNSLADIAEYFFDTDLRDPAVAGTPCTGAVANQDVCNNNVSWENVPNVGVEQVTHQRMTTYALGLGVAGSLTYRPDYDTATTGDFYSIRNGSLAWPDPNVASTSWTVIKRADDLWHAAVNGRGRYYSASSPSDLVTGLTGALDTIASSVGTGGAAATSSQQPVSGDNFVYLAQYTTVLWEGNVKAFTIDPSSGVISTTPLWEARNTLRAQTAPSSDTRTIYFRNASVSGTQRAAFTYANLNAAGLGSSFVNACQTGNYKLSQCASLVAQGAAVQTAANDGNNMVNYLRGRRGLEDIVANATTDRLFRARTNTPMGDVVNAAPVYVKKPPFRYADAGYSTFASNQANRTGVVYVAANDGMLHAFDATTGNELWAYVPTAVMSNLWRLADANYDVNHRYFVDGTPVVGDVFDGTNWRTILVGGLGGGGRAYYALDVTDPANPISLWEISSNDDADLGLTYGNPVITKNKAGTWVVAFTSGYNNTSSGDGNGHLYVRNAITGASIAKIDTFITGTTPAGTSGAPSNLGKINPWIEDETDNTAARIYGGDMLGYMWRFDFDNNIAPAGNEAFLLGRALTAASVPQPITTKPILAKVGNVATLPTVTFATGRYLGASDVGDTTLQSIYVVKDPLTSTSLGTLRSNAGMVQQTMATATVNGVATRRVSVQPVDWSARNGWYIDLSLTAGERVNVDMLQTGRLLTVASNIPAPTPCNPGGTSWLYFFDISNGEIGDALLSDALTAGLNIVKLGDTIKIIQWDTLGRPRVTTPVVPGGASATLRRTSWRELVN